LNTLSQSLIVTTKPLLRHLDFTLSVLFDLIIYKGIGSVWSAKVVTFGDADFNQNELINQLVISPLT
jgi:hypothetical protein